MAGLSAWNQHRTEPMDYYTHTHTHTHRRMYTHPLMHAHTHTYLVHMPTLEGFDLSDSITHSIAVCESV